MKVYEPEVHIFSGTTQGIQFWGTKKGTPVLGWQVIF